MIALNYDAMSFDEHPHMQTCRSLGDLPEKSETVTDL